MIENQESILLLRVKKRLYDYNQNWLCIVIGATGSGKSWLAIRLAELLDSQFNKDNIVFAADSFLEFVQSYRMRKGSVIVWDEAGVSLSSRQSMTRINKAIGFYLQSFRSRNTALIFTLPSLAMLDRQARQLAHVILETKRIDRQHNECIFKWLEVSTNPRSGKIYQKYPRIRKPDGIMQKVIQVRVGVPSLKLRRDYEKKKADFLDNLAKTLHFKMTNIDVKAEARNRSFRTDYDSIVKDIKDNP